MRGDFRYAEEAQQNRVAKAPAITDRLYVGATLGAFADGAVLFPLLILLSKHAGFSFSILCFSAGILYLFSGYFFQIPMSVQPLKSICLSAVALGASYNEVRLSGALLGISCLIFLVVGGKKVLDQIPEVVVRGLQLSLGLLLILQGVQSSAPWQMAILVLCVVLILYSNWRSDFPLFGVLAFVGFVFGFFLESTTVPFEQSQEIRLSVVVSLLLPQIILTLTNSVVGAELTARQYYQERAHKVTSRNLLLSIGLGNLLMAPFGGLPFCHGSGGITAHYRAGARHWGSSLITGALLIGLSVLPASRIQYPPILLGVLLILVGFFHLQLARPAWQGPSSRTSLILMAFTTLLTHNLLYSFAIGLFWELFVLPKMVKTHDLVH